MSTALLTFLGPVLAALVPYLMNRVIPLVDRIFKHTASTTTGILGAGMVGTLLTAFPCLTDMAAWQKIMIAAIPLIFGALSASKPNIESLPKA